jgi:hypothetical protein
VNDQPNPEPGPDQEPGEGGHTGSPHHPTPTPPGPAVGGRVWRWWQQASRRRRLLTAAAAATTVVVAAVGIAAGTAGGAGRPEEVIAAYLAAIRRGQTQQALQVAGVELGDWEPAETVFLTDEVPVGDWHVLRLVRRYPWEGGSDAVIDVTIATGDGATTGTGRFGLARDAGDGPWRIEQPFGELGIGFSPPPHVEVGGIVRPTPAPGSRLLLWPGIYQLWTHLDALLAGTPPVMVALPGAAPTSPPGWELSQAGQHAAQQAVNTFLDWCARRTDLQPPCPFGADSAYIEVGEDYLTDATDLDWRVIEYPQVLAVLGSEGYQVAPRRGGTVALSGTGTPTGGGDARAFQTRCRIEVDTLRLRLTPQATFQVTGGEGVDTCWY